MNERLHRKELFQSNWLKRTSINAHTMIIIILLLQVGVPADLSLTFWIGSAMTRVESISQILYRLRKII